MDLGSTQLIVKTMAKSFYEYAKKGKSFPVTDDDIIDRLRLWPSHEMEKGSVFTIGSCFARNIEEALSSVGYDVPMLEFSVPEEESPGLPRQNGIINKYTLQNILQFLDWITQCQADGKNIVAASYRFAYVGKESSKIVDLDMSGFIPVSEERFERRRIELFDAANKIRECDYVVITLGQTEAWRYGPMNCFFNRAPVSRYLMDTHKFTWLDSVNHNSAMVYARQIVGHVRNLNPTSKIIFSVSPIAASDYWNAKDGLMGYWDSKIILRDTAIGVSNMYKDVFYYPSFDAVAMLDRDKRGVADETVRRVVGSLTNKDVPLQGHDDYFDNVYGENFR